MIINVSACTPTVSQINDYVNRVPYRTDMENWGVPQHVATPKEFFARGGDCEDYVIAKRHELKRYNYDTGKMIFVTTTKGICHVVLKVKHKGKEWIMDNLVHGLQPVSYLKTFKKMGCDLKNKNI